MHDESHGPSGRRPSAGRLIRQGLLVAILAGAVVAVLHVADGREAPEQQVPEGRSVPPEAPHGERPLGPALAGSGGAQRLAPERGRGATSASETARTSGAYQPTSPSATAPSAVTAALLAAFSAIAPRAIHDGVAADAPLPIPLERSDVVGRVGPYGVRDTASVGALRWVGVARIERADRAASEAADDTRGPATTAVRGVVVGEDGKPIRGAEVILYSSFYLRQAFYDHRVRQIGRAPTDADGVFDVRPIELDTVHFGAGGNVLVTVRHPHFPDLVAQPIPAIVPGRESDIGRLVLPEKGVTLHGVIRDLAGRPVPGAVVRASGAFNPVEYDKTERMVVLGECPSAGTDEKGRYELTDFAPGVHELSIHVNIDCVLHVSGPWEGEREWSPQVLAGNGIRGRVVDPEGTPIAAAVVAGGGNWTPTNADGTFWLDNVQAGPLTLEVAHHAWHTVFVPGVPTSAEEITVTMERLLSRVTLTVVDAAEAPVPLVAIDWTWPPGRGPGPFTPDSRFWHDPRGVFALVVPEGAVGATVSDAKGATHSLAAEDLLDGATPHVVLANVPAAR